MSKSSISITVFGVYLGVLGAALIFIPNTILPLLGLAVTMEVWIRVAGLLVLILGFDFLYSVRYDDRRFFRATVFGRLMFFTGVTALALLRLAPPVLVLFGLIDLAGATWTWLSLRSG